jgi:hypothetical protein
VAQDIEQNKQYHFDESQRLTGWRPWTIPFVMLTFFLTILIYQLLTGDQFGSKPASNGLLLCIILLVFLSSILLIRHAKLTIRIDSKTIYYGWNLPTHDLNKINFSDIESCDVVAFNFVGYGYRLTRKYGVVYSASSNKGLQIITKSGEKILVSTHRTIELADALTKLGVRHNL